MSRLRGVKTDGSDINVSEEEHRRRGQGRLKREEKPCLGRLLFLRK